MIPNMMTNALQQALRDASDARAREDLIYLECWERAPLPGSAAALRILQLRRANPTLAARIRDELAHHPCTPGRQATA